MNGFIFLTFFRHCSLYIQSGKFPNPNFIYIVIRLNSFTTINKFFESDYIRKLSFCMYIYSIYHTIDDYTEVHIIHNVTITSKYKVRTQLLTLQKAKLTLSTDTLSCQFCEPTIKYCCRCMHLQGFYWLYYKYLRFQMSQAYVGRTSIFYVAGN